MMLVLPVALQFVLGGFAASGAVALWSLTASLGALVFTSLKVARRLFVGYVALIVLATLAQPLARSGNNLPPALVTIFFVIDIGAVSFVVFVIIARFVNLLYVERAKSEQLLLNVLPTRIARRLREEPDRVIAERFDSATVLFADVVDFTPLSAGLEPEQLVETLNQIFSDFDALADKHGAEKIKTIGDSYMAAAGVPTPRPDHAAAIANLALDMAEYCVARPDRSGTSLRFRIGINSGPIVAGVIGRKKFSYDLWGDTVNTAARMESQAEPGTIQMTESSCNLLRDTFVCQERGVIDVKGKGPMPVWILVGRKT